MKLLIEVVFCMAVFLVILAACTPATPAASPQPTLENTLPHNIPTLQLMPAYPAVGQSPTADPNLEPFFEGSSLSMSKTDSGVALLIVAGDLPTPCNRLTYKVAPPDDQNQVKVSLAIVPPQPGENCIQVTQAVKQEIPLGKLPAGTYSVLLNGQLVGKITVP